MQLRSSILPHGPGVAWRSTGRCLVAACDFATFARQLSWCRDVALHCDHRGEPLRLRTLAQRYQASAIAGNQRAGYLCRELQK